MFDIPEPKRTLESIYKESFFNKRKSLLWRAPIMIDALTKTFSLTEANSIIDVGCANGEFVEEFLNRGFNDSWGIEGSNSSKKFSNIASQIYYCDLREDIRRNFFLRRNNLFNLCYSFEVAEHIEKEYSDMFIDNLIYLSNTILISAAKPGQKGHYHVNCQYPEYWEDKFEKRKYSRCFDLENVFRTLLEAYKKKKGISGYYDNSMIFKRIEEEKND